MRLQADPTVRFAIGDFTIQRISNDDLNVTSPYNTYRNDGLPPGPIRTIDKRTVQSILDSKPHDDPAASTQPPSAATTHAAHGSNNTQPPRQQLHSHSLW